MHNIAHDIRYILIFDISIQFKLCRYCITGLMYHDMAIYRYIVASLHRAQNGGGGILWQIWRTNVIPQYFTQIHLIS